MSAPLLAQVLAVACGLACGEPSPPAAAASGERCPHCVESHAVDVHAVIMVRARSAARDGAWNEAAELWRQALLINGRVAAHWVTLGDVLSNAERYREAVAAYQRAIQLDARLTRAGTRGVARSFARMGNHRQAVRWLEQRLRVGVSPAELWDDEAFERYRHDPRLHGVMKRQVGSSGDVRLPSTRS